MLNGPSGGVAAPLGTDFTRLWCSSAVTDLGGGAMLGRVTGVYRLADLGGAALGALIGGVVAEEFGLLAPFWIAFAAVGILAVAAWRGLGRVETPPG